MTFSEPVRLEGKRFLRSDESRILASVTSPNLSMALRVLEGLDG